MRDKSYISFMTFVLLLVAALPACGQSGTLENHGNKMRYSFSGGTITHTGEVMTASNNRYATWQEIQVEVTAGTTISGTIRRLAGPDGLDAIGQGPIRIGYHAYNGDKLVSKGGDNSRNGCSISYTIPHGVTSVELSMSYMVGGMSGYISARVYYTVKPGPTPPPAPEPEGDSEDCDCDYIKDDKGKYQFIDSHIRFNDLWGEVSYRPNWDEDDAYEFADIDVVLYECYRIRTREESGAILGLEDMSTYVIKEESILVIKTEDGNISKLDMLVGSMWGNIKKMAAGKSLECEMSQCVAGITDGNNGMPLELRLYYGKHTIHEWEQMGVAVPNGNLFKGNPADDNIVFACDVKNGVGTAYVFKGTMTIKNKNNKKYTLKAGQSGTIGKDSKITVKKFDAKKIAKKFGITNADLQGYRKPTLSATNTATVVKRYEMERAIVKYKVTQGTHQGVLAKAFDKYGQYERRELKIGNVETIALTQGSASYALDKKTKKAKRTKDADLNFLNLNETLMKKLKLQKKGTATVMGKQCDHYVGTNVEYYVWKGLVMKKVQKESDGTTTIHEVTSIEEPTSVDPSLFKVPSGYTVK